MRDIREVPSRFLSLSVGHSYDKHDRPSLTLSSYPVCHMPSWQEVVAASEAHNAVQVAFVRLAWKDDVNCCVMTSCTKFKKSWLPPFILYSLCELSRQLQHEAKEELFVPLVRFSDDHQRVHLLVH